MSTRQCAKILASYSAQPQTLHGPTEESILEVAAQKCTSAQHFYKHHDTQVISDVLLYVRCCQTQYYHRLSARPQQLLVSRSQTAYSPPFLHIDKGRRRETTCAADALSCNSELTCEEYFLLPLYTRPKDPSPIGSMTQQSEQWSRCIRNSGSHKAAAIFLCRRHAAGKSQF